MRIMFQIRRHVRSAVGAEDPGGSPGPRVPSSTLTCAVLAPQLLCHSYPVAESTIPYLGQGDSGVRSAKALLPIRHALTERGR